MRLALRTLVDKTIFGELDEVLFVRRWVCIGCVFPIFCANGLRVASVSLGTIF